jgi:hypothetical protein
VADASAHAAGSTGADAEAERRVAIVLQELEHLDLNVVVLSRPDEHLVHALERARDAALVAGRRDLLESATRGAREVALRAFSRSGFSGTWAATDMGASVVRADDRVAAAAAFEAAATAAVAEDVIDAETAEILREPTDALRRTTGLPPPGALSNFTSGRGRGSTNAIPVVLAILVVVAGVVVGYLAGALAIGLLVIVAGLTLLGLLGRRRSAS